MDTDFLKYYTLEHSGKYMADAGLYLKYTLELYGTFKPIK